MNPSPVGSDQSIGASADDIGVALANGAEQARWLTDHLRPHEMAVRGYLRSQFPSVEADDVVQESYLRLMRAPVAGKISSAKAYFFTVARNTARRVFRRRQIFSGVPVIELPGSCLIDERNNVVEITNAHQRHALVIEAIDQLPPRRREVVQLAALQGLLPKEIAAALGMAENTVRVQMARGVKTCADYMRERGERE